MSTCFVFPGVLAAVTLSWVIAGDKIGVGLEIEGLEPEPCVGWFFPMPSGYQCPVSRDSRSQCVLEAEVLTAESELVLFPPSMHLFSLSSQSRRLCCVSDTHWNCLRSQSRIQTTCWSTTSASASSMLPHPIQMRCWVQIWYMPQVYTLPWQQTLFPS